MDYLKSHQELADELENKIRELYGIKGGEKDE